MEKVKNMPAILAALALLLAAACVLFVNTGAAAANADTKQTGFYSFYFENYDVTYDISNDRSMSVTEYLTVNYTGYENTGFIQYIPVNGGELVKNIEAYDIVNGAQQDVPFTVYSESVEGVEFICVDIGDYSIKKGAYSYLVKYDYYLTKAQEGNDLLYLNAIGIDRQIGCDIKSAAVTLILPDGYIDGTCYTGKLNNTNETEFLKSTNADGRTVLKLENTALDYNEGVTFRLNFKSGALKTYVDYIPYLSLIAAIALLGVLLNVRMLFFNKHTLTPVVNFEAPNKMDPLLMGKLIDNKVNSEDITAMIFYWADKGYIKINLDDKDDPTLIRIVKDLPATCSDYEQIMYRDFFRGRDTVKPSELKYTFYKTVENVTARVNNKAKGLYDSKSIGVSIIFALLGAIILGLVPLLIGITNINSSFVYFFGFVFFVPALIIYALSETVMYYSLKISKSKKLLFILGIAALCVVFSLLYILIVPSYIMGWLAKLLLCLLCSAEICCSVLIISRTKEYTSQLNEIVGFKNFILLAEKDRLETLLEDDPQFYYHILPYAQVLDVSDKWEEKFSDITVEPPRWATTSLTQQIIEFHILNSIIRNSMVRMGAQMVSRPASSGGSGSGFGGFSGGGHVGGGHGGGGFRGR